VAQADVRPGRLFRLYERYVGEPDSEKDVYGYWLFIAGYLVSFAGIGLFLSGLPNQGAGGVNIFYWRLSISLAAFGLPLAMLGIVLLLPVRWRGVEVTLGGAAISVLGVLGFVWAYPEHWRSGMDYTSEIVALYTVGIAVMAGVAVLVPVVTGKQGMFVEDELLNLADQPPVMVGEATGGTLFSVFRTPEKDWTWRAIRQDAVADSTRRAGSRTAARESVQATRELVSRAGLLEITTAAFRLYENDDEWRWVLMSEDGGVVAESGTTYGARDGVERSVSFTKDSAPDAPLIEIDGAAVDYRREGEDWHWRLVDEDRNELATDVGPHVDRDAAESAVGEMQSLLPEARVLALEGVGAELYADGDDWRWRLVDDEDAAVVESAGAFDGRRLAESSVDGLLDGVADATLVERGRAGYEVYADGNAWAWRLLDADDAVVARNHERADDAGTLSARAETMAATAADADVVTVDGADYEVYPGDDGWHWRFVTEDRTVVADHEGGYETPEEAREAIETVREQASEADLIEFETAAFQQYQTDDDRWRWRLIDEGGAVLADSGQAYDSKAGAGDAMQTLKDTAPDAEILEIETAAFELIRTDDDQWRWRLVDEGGYLIAEGASKHPSRQAAREAMDLLTELSPDAAVRELAAPVFQLYADDDDWAWRYVTVDNRIVADAAETRGTRDDAADHVEDVRATAADAPVDTVDDYAVELDEDDGTWSWHVVDASRDEVATGTKRYERREDAVADVETVRRGAETAPIFEIETAAVRVTRTDGDYGWVLIDGDRETYARSGRRYETRAAVIDAVERLQELAPDAASVNFDDAGFEPFRGDDGWRWRLLDDRERAVAVGSTPYDDRAAAVDRIEAVRDLVAGASVLEIDDPAFELHYEDDGWIWRLVDADGDALASSIGTYPTREEAREAMQTLKDQAPDGHVTVAQ